MSQTTDRRRPRHGQLAPAAARMLLASYFLASAGLIKNADGATFLSSILPTVQAEALATSIFYGTGFALMIGRFMREAALILSIFIFWSSFGASLNQAPGGERLMSLWRDMALVGAVLLIGLMQPGGIKPLHLAFWRRRQPRRITPEAAVARRLDRPKTLRTEPLLTEQDDPDDDENIFADLYPA